MTKKNLIVLSAAILAVAGFYLYLYKDSFRKQDIHISMTIRPKTSALIHRTGDTPLDADSVSIDFGLGHPYKLTSIKVVSLNALQTNKYAHPVWELTTDSNSAPVHTFAYGNHIHGMHPAIKGATADPLAPNTPYRLLIEAGSEKGHHDFTISEDEHLIQ